MGKGRKTKQAATAVADAEHRITGKAAEQRDAPVVAALGKAGEIADQPPLFALAAGTLALGLVLRRPQLTRTGARMLVAEAVATGIKTVVKRSVDRTRPAKALRGGGHQVGHGRGARDSDFNSFPSGHTAGAVAVGQAAAHGSPAVALPAKLAAAGIGAVQLPRGKHYLSDVAVGAAIGWVAERIAGAAVDAAERAWTRRRIGDPLAEAEAHPS
jgi:membrane-associated phospholipid phosphatase